jgi:hypothetical protein
MVRNIVTVMITSLPVVKTLFSLYGTPGSRVPGATYSGVQRCSLVKLARTVQVQVPMTKEC